MRRIPVVLGTRYSVLRHLVAVIAWAMFPGPWAAAQIVDRSTHLPPAEVEQIDSSSAAHLENAIRFLAERQWSEAVESIRRVQEAEPSRLVRVDTLPAVAGFERYITADEYCQWRLASLATEAPEALAHYRRLVDSLAETWLREGEKNNDELMLAKIVQQAFASRFGDDALLKLGDIALARGDIGAARGAWQRISTGLTVPPSAAGPLRAQTGTPVWLALRTFDFAGHGDELKALLAAPRTPPPGVYPDTDIDLASVHARFVLAGILEGSRQRATVELAILRLLYPEAEGTLAGRRGRYSDLLQILLDESDGWSPMKPPTEWPTIAGNSTRARVAVQEIDMPGRLHWSYPLPRLTAEREILGSGRLRAGDDAKSLLSYHPIVAQNKVLLRLDGRGNSYVVALDLKTGERLWQVDYSRGFVREPTIEAIGGEQQLDVNDAHRDLSRHLGVARYTLSASGQKLFARLGSPVTIPSSRRAERWLAKDQGFLLGLDLATQGKPLEGFPIRPASNAWTFEGSPLCDDGAAYVVMRQIEGARSQLYLAAFELETTPSGYIDDRSETTRPAGRLKWRTRICSSATLGGGDVDQLTHLLVTRDGDRLYLNTSAGVVAAVNADDGRMLWLVKYPRSSARSGQTDQPEQHLFRDLTPCLAWKDLIIVAPADCERIFALEAATGQLAWTLAPGAADDAVHLLGVADDTFAASGDSLYFIDAHSGRLLTQFPVGRLGGAEQAAPSPRGFGRGLIAGNHVWWPTRESIFVFEARPAATAFGWQPRLVREIPLVAHGVTGGNLVLAGGVLLIAGGDRLVAFGQ